MLKIIVYLQNKKYLVAELQPNILNSNSFPISESYYKFVEKSTNNL